MDKHKKLSNPKQAISLQTITVNQVCTFFIYNLFTCKISPYMVKDTRIATLKMICNGLKVKNISCKGIKNLYIGLWYSQNKWNGVVNLLDNTFLVSPTKQKQSVTNDTVIIMA
jgi:hypothetical protein